MTSPRENTAVLEASPSPPQRQVVNLVLDDQIVAAIQREAAEIGEDRSTLVRAVLRRHFGLRRIEFTPPLT